MPEIAVKRDTRGMNRPLALLSGWESGRPDLPQSTDCRIYQPFYLHSLLLPAYVLDSCFPT